MALPRLDLLEEVELAYGHRVGLGILAEANLGIGKSGHGLDAIKYYNEGDFKALEDYCIQDVRVTRKLYEFIKDKGYLMIPKKFTNEVVKVPISLHEAELPATLF